VPRRRLLAIAAALATLALCAPAGASADDCGGADLVPAADNLSAAGQATLCLLNEQRAANGVAALTVNARLTSASAGYSQRMVDQAFFAHESPDGGTLVDRLTGAGYLVDDAWVVGENLGWGQGSLATPRAMVQAWMASPGHRANLLSADYAEVGLGIALGTPTDRSWGATYTTDFGAVSDGAADTSASATPSRAASRHVASSRSKPAPRKKKKAVARAACARAASAGRHAQAAKPAKTCARKARVRHR
jgi:uncharacterized protein YkwD